MSTTQHEAQHTEAEQIAQQRATLHAEQIYTTAAYQVALAGMSANRPIHLRLEETALILRVLASAAQVPTAAFASFRGMGTVDTLYELEIV